MCGRRGLNQHLQQVHGETLKKHSRATKKEVVVPTAKVISVGAAVPAAATVEAVPVTNVTVVAQSAAAAATTDADAHLC